MLSVENSPPTSPDPHLILKPSTTANPQNHELDLPPLPHFSIRDYVSTARSNDIKRNWPFSLKNLQLCLKHGVKDVLPPFQPLDAVRNQAFINKTSSVERRTVTLDNNNNNNYYHDHQSIRNIISDEDDHQPSRSDHHDQLITSNKNLPDQYHDRDHLGPNIASCGTTGDNCFPSSTTNTPSVYDQSEIIEESVVIPRSTSSPLQTDTTTSTSLEAASVDQVAAEPAAPRVTGHKTSTQSTTRNSGKRCRLIVKFGSNSDRNSAEDIASNCTNQSETMASKICPVCKTFSSPSNTTLNAHIDQCLSAESSAPKWTLDSKLTRHRIKPRKTRLMVDIYAMAKCCTLEDLDRRNGSNWAAFSSFPSHEESEKSEMTPVEEQTSKQEAPPHDHHQTSSADHVGAVYIDANGIKLRILSKSDDIPSVSKVIKEHLRPRKPYKGGGKGSKFLSARKSKRRASKFNKYFKVKLAQGKKLLSTKARSSQISGVQGKKYGAGTSYKKERSNMQKQISVNPCNTGTLRQWACSKRTGVAKKLINKVSHQLVQYSKWQVSTENLGVENNQSRAHSPTSGLENREEQLVDLSGNIPVSNIFYDEAEACHKEEERSSGSKTRGHFVERNSLTPMKRNARQLRKERATVNDYHMPKPPNSELASAITSTKPSRSCHASRSKSMKISSARNDMISLALERSRAHLMTEMDDEVVLWDSELDHGPYDFNHNFAASQYGREDTHDETSLCRSNGLEMRRNTGVLSISRRKETVRSESSQLPFQYYADKEVENVDSSVSDKVDDDQGPASEDFQHSVDEIVPQVSPKLAVAENLVLSSHKSVELDNHALQYKGPICDVEVLTGPSGQHFAGRQEMFYADQLGNGLEELDSDVGQGSSFPDVDPIPIPGPPGSYLPSPRDMGSDDFQGNSSLTTSRVQSSQDQHDFVDGDSSDSPISATSTVSNSTGSRYDLKCSEPLVPSVVAPDHAVRDHKFKSSLSGGSVDSSIESAPVIVPQTAERLAFNKEKFKVNNKLPQSFIKSDHDEPCCCQRKERASQGVMFNYQESPLLKRRAMASSVVLPPMEKQSGCNLNTIRPSNAESRLPDVFSPRPEKVVLPVTSKSPASENISRGGSGESAGVKFSGRGDYDSVSPSSSNSILRLMGKNLMVVNRDQDESMPTGQSQPQSQINHLITSQFSPFSGVSQNQVHHHSFHPNFQQGSVFLGQDGYPHYDAERQCVVDARTSTSFPRLSPQMFCPGAASSFPNQHVRGGFATTLELREFKADHNNGAEKKSRHRSPIGAPLTIPAHHHCQNVLPPAAANYSVKEIITIDDVSENEADLAGHGVAKYSGGLREEGPVVSTSGIVIPSYNDDTKYRNPFFTACPLNQDHQSILPDNQSPLVLPNTGFHSLPSSRQVNNTSPVRWNGGGSGGSSGAVLQQSPFIASNKSPSSRGGHLRSAMYNCQSLM